MNPTWAWVVAVSARERVRAAWVLDSRATWRMELARMEMCPGGVVPGWYAGPYTGDYSSPYTRLYVGLYAGWMVAMAEVAAGESVEDAQRVGWGVVEQLSRPEDPADPYDAVCRGWGAEVRGAVEQAARARRHLGPCPHRARRWRFAEVSTSAGGV